MREIKFRVWDKKKMVFPEDRIYSVFWNPDMNRNEVQNGLGDFFSEETHAIQQFTGLKDKNGVEIYEGDILKCPWGFDKNEYFSEGEVVFWEGEFVLSKGPEKFAGWVDICPYDLYEFNDTPTRKCFWNRAEVIGNIFENKELLK